MTGSGFQNGGQHSDFLEAWFRHTPGIKVVMPSNPVDGYGLLHLGEENRACSRRARGGEILRVGAEMSSRIHEAIFLVSDLGAGSSVKSSYTDWV